MAVNGGKDFEANKVHPSIIKCTPHDSLRLIKAVWSESTRLFKKKCPNLKLSKISSLATTNCCMHVHKSLRYTYVIRPERHSLMNVRTFFIWRSLLSYRSHVELFLWWMILFCFKISATIQCHYKACKIQDIFFFNKPIFFCLKEENHIHLHIHIYIQGEVIRIFGWTIPLTPPHPPSTIDS